MIKMGNSFFSVIAGIIFLCGALLHGFRAYHGYDIVYNGWLVPVEISWLVALVAFIMALLAFKNLK